MKNLLDQAVRDRVFPGCVAVVFADGEVRYEGAHGTLGTDNAFCRASQAVETNTIYDLASLTKVLCTTTLAALAVDLRRVDLKTAVPSEWARGCPGATLADLLEHCSGLAAHRDFFSDVAPFDDEAMLEAVTSVPPQYELRQRHVYSDLGFIILGAWLQRLFDQSLVDLFGRYVVARLGVSNDELGFRPIPKTRAREISEVAPLDRIAPTEVYLESLHPRGVPSHYDVRCAQRVAIGEVHDDNAFVMGGVAGHAGLFGTAAAVLAVARAWLEPEVLGLSREVRDRFWRPSQVPGSTRRLGFDGPSLDGSGTAGTGVTSSAVGHTGYTGTSLWIDPAAVGGPKIYVLLSNRVHPVRSNENIKTFRPRFHEMACKVQ